MATHVVSVTPAGPLTLPPGGTVTFNVQVTGPLDTTGSATFTASDGSLVTVHVTIDRVALTGIVTGTPTDTQVLGTVTSGIGTLTSVGPVAGGWQFTLTAPAS